MTPSDAVVPPQFGLRKAPEVLNPVNVPTATVGKRLLVQDPVVPIPIGEQTIIAAESIRGNGAPARDLLSNDPSQHRPGHIGDRPGVHAAAPLQEPKDNTFPLNSSAAQMLADAPEVALIDFNFSIQPGLRLARLDQCSTNQQVDALGCVTIDPDFLRGPVGGDLQSKEPNQCPELSGRQMSPGQQGRGHASA